MGPISIPEYYKRFIDPKVDLDATPKICCPFHKEDTPSFSYSAAKGVWRCFGACHTGGDVIAMHMKHYGLRSRTEAQKSLNKLLGISTAAEFVPKVETGKADEYTVTQRVAYNKAIQLARTPEDWVELDYIMSLYPQDTQRLDVFINARGGST